jgi:5-methylcytosine-specific restriction enzyme B
VDERVLREIRARYEQLLSHGQLPQREKLRAYYETFRQRFGPDALRRLDGEELLNVVHAHGSRDSLVYWLEFKNDEEFPDLFGSIAGGSALKFGIYRRKETGAWMTGGEQGQQEITLAAAIAVARSHRDQLVAATHVLEQFDSSPTDESYALLQRDLVSVAPDVCDSAWGHKYLSVLYPEKLDDFHVVEFQHFYVRKMLELPPPGEGRYVGAGRYVNAAAELQAPMNHLTATLKDLFGRPYRVWRVGTKIGGTESVWDLMRDRGIAAIGWHALGDLSDVANLPDARTLVLKKLEADGSAPQLAGREATQVYNFISRVSENDLVLAADGELILGIGRITGPYRYDPSMPHAPNHRPVTWLETNSWRLPETEGLRSTVRQLKKSQRNLVEVERRLFASQMHRGSTIAPIVEASLSPLQPIPARIQSVLERKGQVILYGPPGTGKTHWATIAARELAARTSFGKSFDGLSSEARTAITAADGLVRTCTFHPAYGYEDFIEGYRPSTSASGQLTFSLHDGIFKRLCSDAERQPERRFYLLIDEINRGDIPRIFGELITLLELNKRNQPLHLPVSGAIFRVPRNICVVGTMNTADRSIALLDTALRRRFGFIELMPDPDALGDAMVANSIPLRLWLLALNARIRQYVPQDGRNLQIGHAYFLENGRPVADFARFTRILAEDIIPLIEEYCYEDFGALRDILGTGLVDEENRRLKSELLVPDRREELIQALLAPSPDLVTSSAAIAAEPTEGDAERDEIAE